MVPHVAHQFPRGAQIFHFAKRAAQVALMPVPLFYAPESLPFIPAGGIAGLQGKRTNRFSKLSNVPFPFTGVVLFFLPISSDRGCPFTVSPTEKDPRFWSSGKLTKERCHSNEL